MKLELIRIQGYKSLADLELHPGDFTVLVGPNGSGKSNVLGGLDFIADIYKSGVTFAIDRRGGFANIALREHGTPRHTLTFEIEISGTVGEIWGVPITSLLPEVEDIDEAFFSTEVRFRHRFSLRGEGEQLISNFEVSDEIIEITRAGVSPGMVFRGSRNGLRFESQIGSDTYWNWLGLSYFDDARDLFSRTFEIGLLRSELSIDRFRILSPFIRVFVEFFKTLRPYQFVPAVCRSAAAPTPVADLGMYGENLPALVYHLKNQSGPAWLSDFGESRSPWSNVLERMILMLPGLDDIEVVPTFDRQWSLEFLEVGLGNRWTADEVSDGTVRALALFSSVYDPQNALLAFEEPENSLHPWILREFIESCREQSSRPNRKQIILTTHSPALVDWLVPSEVAVVWREGGRTQILPLLDLEPEIVAPWKDGSIKLSSFLDSGLLRQAVPHR